MSFAIITLLVIIAFFTVYIFYKLLLYPLSLALYFKLKYGNEVIFMFYPILGIIYYIRKSFNQYKDSLKILRIQAMKNPKAKFIISNIGPFPLFHIIDIDVFRDLT